MWEIWISNQSEASAGPESLRLSFGVNAGLCERYSQRLFQTPTETAGAQAPLSPLGQTDGLANFPALFQIARLLQAEYETSLCLFAVCYC